MSIKEKFESHPVVFGFTMILVGFAAGFTTKGYLPFEPNSSEAKTYTAQKPITCQVENLSALEGNHGQRILNLQKALMEQERKATDELKISSYQEKYKESAERLRKDIGQEYENYQTAMRQLNLRCKEA
jgi:hypothetical protein